MKSMPVSAKAVLVTRDRKALILRKVSTGRYDLPGGRIERGEGLFKGLRREVAEETGIRVKSFDFVASWVKEFKGERARLMLIFRGRLPVQASDIDIILSEEHDWWALLPAKKILSKNMDVGYKTAIANSLQQKLRL